ncbi:trichohyalin-like isoform X3 [Solea solea]|uniref:trichohyalin-like isoform X3 n=1 Tax=Solea solea TaxID=90069 RepID=UPI00272A3FDA|nr:trichohyalin-like isoform X3 [Solea solea]
MSSLQCFRDLITERLTVAAEEIFRHVERTVVEYEEELDRQRKLLEIVCKPRVKLKRIELPQQHVPKEEEVLTEQQLCNQERNSSLDQEEPESLQIKEEQEEICTSHEGEQLEVKQEADTLMLTPENEESDHMEPGRNLQHRLFMKWGPVIKLQRTELPQQHVCKEEEVLTEQQLCNQERNSSLDQEEPESIQIKEEQAVICTSHEGEQLEVKQEADTLMLTPENEESDHMEPGRNEEDVDLQHRLHMKWGPVIKLQRTELPQQHVCKEEEVLTEQQLWNQERNSSLDQEEPESLQIKEEQEETCTSHEGEQLEVKQEADTLMLTPDNEESDHMEPGRNEEDVDLQHRLHMKWGPVIKLQSTELPQQHVCKEEEVLTEQQLWNQERNSSLDQEEPESLQIKEEEEEICTSHEGEQLEVKQEADTLMLTPDNEESDHMEPGRNEEDVDLQHRLHMKWGPVIKLQRTELPQQHVPKEEEVLTEQHLCNQERNSSLDQEEPESLQSTEEQEADTLMLTHDNEESDHMEPETDSDHQLLSHSSPAAQSQDQTGSHHVDSLSNRIKAIESKPCKRRNWNKVENCDTSKIESKTPTSKKSFRCNICGKRMQLCASARPRLVPCLEARRSRIGAASSPDCQPEEPNCLDAMTFFI